MAKLKPKTSVPDAVEEPDVLRRLRESNSGPPSPKFRQAAAEKRKKFAELRSLHPEWTIRELATGVGCSKSQIQRFMEAERGEVQIQITVVLGKKTDQQLRKLAASRKRTRVEEVRLAIAHWLKSSECR